MRSNLKFPRAINSLILAICLFASGCGYQFVGNGALLPKDARTVFVESFVNRSRDVGIEKEIATALRGEFYRRGPLRVVDQFELADVILTGVVRPVDTNTVASVNGKDEALQYYAVLLIDVSLRQRESNNLIWRADAMRLSDLYAGSRAAVVTTSSDFRTGTLNAADVGRLTDAQLTEFQRRDSRRQLMEQIAKEVYQRLMEMF
jgi:lipopolysaccharide assembly LptE-like protein